MTIVTSITVWSASSDFTNELENRSTCDEQANKVSKRVYLHSTFSLYLKLLTLNWLMSFHRND